MFAKRGPQDSVSRSKSRLLPSITTSCCTGNIWRRKMGASCCSICQSATGSLPVGFAKKTPGAKGRRGQLMPRSVNSAAKAGAKRGSQVKISANMVICPHSLALHDKANPAGTMPNRVLCSSTARRALAQQPYRHARHASQPRANWPQKLKSTFRPRFLPLGRRLGDAASPRRGQRRRQWPRGWL